MSQQHFKDKIIYVGCAKRLKLFLISLEFTNIRIYLKLKCNLVLFQKQKHVAVKLITIKVLYKNQQK